VNYVTIGRVFFCMTDMSFGVCILEKVSGKQLENWMPGNQLELKILQKWLLTLNYSIKLVFEVTDNDRVVSCNKLK
jgi:hypothetical protein